MALTTTDLLQMYRTMLLIRRFEERATQYFLNGQIRGSFHPCIGQEATAVGACAALRRDDYMTCTYRGHGQSIAKGLDPNAAMAELLGRRTGCSQGKGGSMHYTDPSVGLLGENAIVGAGVPIAVGAALTAQLDKTDQVALTFFGDGAVNQGVFLETMNLAVIWKLPVIFFCENNLYSEMTPIRAMVGPERLIERAAGFGMRTAMIADAYDPDRRVRDDPGGRGTGACRRRADLHRGDDLPPGGPHDRRQRAVSHEGRGGRVAQARLDHRSSRSG